MEDSPVWKKPSEVMKIHRRRKSVSQRRISTDADKRTSLIYKSPSKAKKRNNPFVCNSEQPSKRQHIETCNQENHEISCQNTQPQLFDILDTVDQRASTKTHMPLEPVLQQASTALEVPAKAKSSVHPLDSNARQTQTKPLLKGNMVHTTEDKRPLPYFPVDWSLKTKMRVVSSRPLNWCTQLRSTEEAVGVARFVESSTHQPESLSEQKAAFQQSCMYWIHPNLPWACLFPRIVDDSKHSMAFTPVMNDAVQKSLQTDWEQSFSSAYYQLRAGLCPYFYLCTHQFTGLFFNDTVTQSGPIAMVTPTTRGFRELLENEGISFKLPVGGEQSSPGRPEAGNQASKAFSGKSTGERSGAGDGDHEDQEEEEDGDDLLETDDAASGWLESMGLDKKEFPTLDPRNVKLQREGFRVIDHRPESLVYVAGADVQALFNLLLNCRSCTAQSGAQAGIAPTILSPAPFTGATLKRHKVKHTAVKQSDQEGHISHAHIVEVSGPILPSHCQALVSLLHQTQVADFGAVYNNHEPTLPFNILPAVLNYGVCKCGGTCSWTGSEELHRGTNSASEAEKVTDENSIQDECTQRGRKCVNDLMCLGPGEDRFFRHMPLSDRVCAIKEFVCTKEGFTITV